MTGRVPARGGVYYAHYAPSRTESDPGRSDPTSGCARGARVRSPAGTELPSRRSMDSLLQDVRYSLRKLICAPAFTLVAVLTLGLAIGATTAVFSLVDGVLLKSLPFRDPDRLIRVRLMRGETPSAVSQPDFLD